MEDFQGRVAVVTGAASGIGYALAERFATEGMNLGIADIHQPSLDEAAAKLRAAGATVLAQRVDVADASAVEAFAASVYNEYGAAHVVCNNAGVNVLDRAPVWEQPLENWRWILGVNLWGVVHGVRAFVPRMLDGGDEGHIVNTASMAGMVIGQAGGDLYSASKHAVVSLTESLYGELKRLNAAVSASVLCPGLVDTNLVPNSRRDAPTRLERGFAPPAGDGVLPPSAMAEAVVAAIRTDRCYVLAGQDYFIEWMAGRHRRIEEGRNPAVPRRDIELQGGTRQ